MPEQQPPTEDAPQPGTRAHRRKLEDTAEGCRAMAEQDLARAAETDTDRMRFRLEHSAGAWTKRADLLERLETSFRARTQSNGAQDGSTDDG